MTENDKVEEIKNEASQENRVENTASQTENTETQKAQTDENSEAHAKGSDRKRSDIDDSGLNIDDVVKESHKNEDFADKSQTLLKIDNIVKRFGGLVALDNVSLEIKRHEIFGLIGPNGAGKTTLFNVLTGLYMPEEGKFVFDGKDLFRVKPHIVVQNGIARTFQNIRLFNNMTVLENVMVGCHVRSKANALGAIFRTKKTREEEERIVVKSYRLLKYVGIADKVNDLANSLSYGDQRRLEIARALASEPKLLALDEPAAGMNPSETAELMELMAKINHDGVTLLVIEHDVKLMMNLCDRIAVLDYGKKIADGVPEEVRSNKRVIEAYLGGTSDE